MSFIRYGKYPTFTLCTLLFVYAPSCAMENNEKRTITKFIDSNAFTSVRNAITQGNIDYLKYLARSGYNIISMKDENTEDTALHLAVEANQPSIVCYLLGLGANVWVINKQNINPLFNCTEEVIKIFAKRKSHFADVQNVNGKTVLSIAVGIGELKMVSSWLTYFDPNPWIKDNNNNSAITYAINNFLNNNDDTSLEILKILIAYALKKSYQFTIKEINRHQYSSTESEAAIKGRIISFAINDSSLTKYKIPLLSDFNINEQDDTGNTIFTHNFYNKYQRKGFIGDQLIQFANLNNQDKEGNTPLHGTMKTTKLPGLLIMGGADISIKNNKDELAIDSINDEREFGWCKKFLTIMNSPDDFIYIFSNHLMVDYFIAKCLYDNNYAALKKLLLAWHELHTNQSFSHSQYPFMKKDLNHINNSLTPENLLLKSYYFRPNVNHIFLHHFLEQSSANKELEERKKMLNNNLNTILFYELLSSDDDKKRFTKEEEKENNLIILAHHGLKKNKTCWSWDNLLLESIKQEKILVKNILIILNMASLSKNVFRLASTMETREYDTYDDVDAAISLRTLLSYLKKSHLSKKNSSSQRHHGEKTLNKIHNLIIEYLVMQRLLIEPMDPKKMLYLTSGKSINTDSTDILKLSPEVVHHILSYLPYLK